MHILSGKYKNRRLKIANLKASKLELRPTKSKIRAAIFNILEHANFLPTDVLEGAYVLDLYCGTGTFGFEALSRGAEHTTFVDLNTANIEMVRFNAENIGAQESVRAVCGDARNLPYLQNRYDIAYIDPPYRSRHTEETISSLYENNLLHQNSIVIVEVGIQEHLEPLPQFHLLDTREYGNTKIIWYRFSPLATSKEACYLKA